MSSVTAPLCGQSINEIKTEVHNNDAFILYDIDDVTALVAKESWQAKTARRAIDDELSVRVQAEFAADELQLALALQQSMAQADEDAELAEAIALSLNAASSAPRSTTASPARPTSTSSPYAAYGSSTSAAAAQQRDRELALTLQAAESAGSSSSATPSAALLDHELALRLHQAESVPVLSRDCSICLETFTNSQLEFPCREHHAYCEPCLRRTIDIAMSAHRRPSCALCHAPMDNDFLQFFLDRAALGRLEADETKSFLQSNKQFVPCPRTGCDLYFWHDMASGIQPDRPGESNHANEARCVCDHTFCLGCRQPFHFMGMVRCALWEIVHYSRIFAF